MVNIRQFHIRDSDVITGILKTSTTPNLPIQVYLSGVNMIAFIRGVKKHKTSYSFIGTVVYGRHPSAKIESDASGFVASEIVPFINVEENVDVKA